MKRAALLLVMTLAVNVTSAFAQATITITTQDPRQNDPNLVDRDWGARLRNFVNASIASEIYVGAGDLDFSGNRKVGELIWNDIPGGVNTFTLTYSPSPLRFTVSASGLTSGSQLYDFQTPIPNPNEFFNELLIQLEARGPEELIITDLVLSITGGATTNLGTMQIPQGQRIFGLIDNINGAYTSGFTLTGNIAFQAGFSALRAPEDRPRIDFFALFDRSQPASADLTLTKTHAGSFVQGQIGATYTLTARNAGAGPTTGTVTVVDNLPPALSATAAGGPGWTCSLSTNTATCTRSDALAPGASYPPITLTVNVAATAPALATNVAAVTGGSDGDSGNNIANDPTTIIRGPDLTITKTAAGSFTQGQMGAGYTLTVTNAGGVGTSGIVTVIDNLPTGLAPTAASGPGWTCGISGNTATCTRSDALATGSSYPPIDLTVNVAATAPPSVTNVATVGGGGDVSTANNTASVVTPIAPASDLTVSKSHTGTFTQGQQATYTVTVSNVGGSATSGDILVSDPMLLPLIPVSGSGTGWTCVALTIQIRCRRSDPLAPGGSYPPITMTVSLAANAPPSVTNVVNVSGGGDGNLSNNSASDVATVLPAADLTIVKNHTGNFTQGQPGTYTVTVSNTGGSPTNGPVTVVDELPVGLVGTAASGAGWNCELAGQSGCSRSDILGPGQSYPPITLTVSVQANAPASVTNTASVSGGGETNSSNNTATDPTTVIAGPNLTITKSHAGNFTQGQAGSPASGPTIRCTPVG